MANPWRYTGGYQDAATGLYKLGHRFYDPSLGRWTQQDPAGVGNRYAYTNCNPINATDPSGLDPSIRLPSEACLQSLGSLLFQVASNVSFAAIAFGGGAVAALLGLAFYFGSAGLTVRGYVQALQNDPTFAQLAVDTVLFVASVQPGPLGLGGSIASAVASCGPTNGPPPP